MSLLCGAVQAPPGSPPDVSQQLLQYCQGIPVCRVVLLERELAERDQQLADQAAQLAERDQQAAQLQQELVASRQQVASLTNQLASAHQRN